MIRRSVFIGLVLLASAASAQQVSITVKVAHATKKGDQVDPGLEKLKKRMADFGFTSYKLLDTRVLQLAMGAEGTVPLPGGKTFVVRAQQIDQDGKLRVHAHVKGETEVTYSIEPGGDLVVGGVPYEDGKLVLLLTHEKK